MKTPLLLSLSAVGAIALAIAAYQWGAHGAGGKGAGVAPVPAASAPQETKVDPANGRRVLYWHDPMSPGTRFDKPGKSPFMDMQLVPVYADEAAGAGVAVSSAVAQSLGMRTALVRRADLSTQVDTVGVVTQNERATQVVQSRVTGYIEKLNVRAVLDPVRKDQPLATLYAPEWASALEEYLGVRKANVGAALVDAARSRLRLLSIPDDLVERSEQTGIAQSRFNLLAPGAGVVAELGVREGAMVSPGMTLFRIVDLGSVWVIADVPEALSSQVRVGSAAEVQVAGVGSPIAGKLSAILPDVDLVTRTVKGRIELRNPGLMLKPGMFVRVTFRPSNASQALLIPQEAVIATGKRNVVILVEDGGKYRPVDVKLGRESGGEVEVLSGLSEGQRVLSSGQFLLDSEASLKSGLGRLDSGKASTTAAVAHAGQGTVKSMAPGEIAIAHGPIASLKWGAMTMTFKTPPGGLPGGLKVGEMVRFEFVQQGDDYVLQSIQPQTAGVRP
jgi:Cu(I)/Ag(I) efflux system membrane fusion protein